ncbi:DNA-binding response regulator [Actinomadura adrarensis]|uniref:DNA-binding response regulator n=1 Tax=Actinomadura adrarensis TaxID=1819600 RepID=A0ABW3CTN3_9ACTN
MILDGRVGDVRVLLAEDVAMVRGALAALIEIEHDLTVVAEVERGDVVLDVARQTRPDVAIIDIDLPVMDGLTVAELLREHLPNCKSLILTSLGRPGLVRRALSLSVSGFLLKDTPSDRLAQAIREVASGRRVIDPQVALTAWDVGDNPLSPRETEVLRLVAQGAEASEIAAQLQLSIGTVRNYLTRIVMKMNARNRVDAVRVAREAGWLP